MRHLLYILFISLLSINCEPGIPSPEVECHSQEDLKTGGGSYNSNTDILFVVDSAMATEHQSALEQAQVPQMVEALITGDIDDDGEIELGPFINLRVGIVSTDLGSSESQSPTCENASPGDDGVLVRDGDTSQKGCLNQYPPFLFGMRYPYGLGTQPEDLLNHLSCLRQLNPNPCAPPQPLEAALKALWPAQDQSISFFNSSASHGDGLNEDFLRGTPYNPTESNSLSLLVVILITNRDDRSLFIPCDFTRDSSCGESLYPIERYVEGIKQLRPDFPELVMMAAITGVPTDLVENKFELLDKRGDADLTYDERDSFYGALLSDPRMQQGKPGNDVLDSVCTNAKGFSAIPSPRIVQTVRAFGPNGAIGSVCSDDYRPILAELIAPLVSSPTSCAGFCLEPRYSLRKQRDGRVNCVLHETLPKDGPLTRCSQLADFGREPEPVDIDKEEGREVCRIRQLGMINDDPPSGFGWYYETNPDAVDDCCRHADTRGFIRPTKDTILLLSGCSVEIECHESIGELFGPCDSDSQCAEEQFCEPINSQCVRACSNDSDCDEEYECKGDSPDGSYCISAC